MTTITAAGVKPTIISLFAGIGGLDLAAHWAGFETVRFVEKEPFCQQVLRKHWPGVPIDDDVFTSHPGYADVVIGGFPCQPFSVAGNRQGKDDERYLLPEMLRIVAEVQPYAVLFENVPGFPSLNDGAEFKYLLRTLAEMGFNAEWGHIRASDIGAPHQRERWFLVAYASSRGRDWWRERGGRIEGNYGGASGVWSSTSKEIKRRNQSELADASAIGRNAGGNNRQERHVLQHVNGNAAQSEPERQGWQRGIEPTVETMGNTERSRRGGFSRGWTGAQLENGYTRAGRAAQPGLGRAANGLPGWLDFVGFPARPSEPQFAYEPPRVVKGAKDRTARIKSLGNAVVPQCAYPIFTALMEWFQQMEKEQAA